METLSAIKKRCSLKHHLSERMVEPEKVRLVLEAACLAPSARNLQPWRFVVVRGQPAVQSLVEAAFSEANQVTKQAPVMLVVCARPEDDVSVDGKDYSLFDSGLAVENLLLAATDLGLVTHLILRFDEQKVKQVLHIPQEMRVVIVTPLAYPLEGSYDAAARERLGERTRKDFNEVVFFDAWEGSGQS
jgi:nitroreductase